MIARSQFQLQVATTDCQCPIGETVGRRHQASKTTPVLSCEGAEIARQAANIVARQPGFGRGCHGEFSLSGGIAPEKNTFRSQHKSACCG